MEKHLLFDVLKSYWSSNQKKVIESNQKYQIYWTDLILVVQYFYFEVNSEVMKSYTVMFSVLEVSKSLNLVSPPYHMCMKSSLKYIT